MVVGDCVPRSRLLRPALILSTVALAFLAQVACAGGGPRNVVVVVNTNSPVSRAIAQYYQAARNIPDTNICYITCPTVETVSGDVCETRIREPIRQFLARPALAGGIDYIVLTKGIPLRADYGRSSSNGPYSVSSILTAVDHPDIGEWFAFPYGPFAIQRWTTAAAEAAWSHSTTYIDRYTGKTYRFYLVTRLDAFTLDDVIGMIDRSCHPDSDGIFALDKAPAVAPYNTGEYNYANLRLGTPTSSAYDHLVKSGFDVRFDGGTDFIAGLDGLMGYFSWANHDPSYSFAKFTSNTFVPGSIADTYWSYSGETFTDLGTVNRAPLMADLFRKGLCGAGAYVSEPSIQSATQPNVLFDRYTKGYNMAESFFAGCGYGFWKTVVIGDPLMAPYATPPVVAIDLPNTVLHGVQQVTAIATDVEGVERVEFYLGQTHVGTATQAPFTISLNTYDFPIGPKTLEVIAYEASPVATQGHASIGVFIDNAISTVTAIDDVRDYALGQGVRVKSKIVTADQSDVGDGFYIQESDRSSGIKVLSGDLVVRGDLVTVSGETALVSSSPADPVITNARVESRISSTSQARPLLMKLSDLGGAGTCALTLPVGRGSGARNTGLLVKVAGKVVSSGNGIVSLTDGSTRMPVMVILPKYAVAPMLGKWLAVTGICTAHYSGSALLPVILPRDPSDIQFL